MHTPGPWRTQTILTASENHKGWRIWGEGGPVCEVYPLTFSGSAKAAANARLIAAAPDLLEIARAVVERGWREESYNGPDYCNWCIVSVPYVTEGGEAAMQHKPYCTWLAACALLAKVEGQ